jgi:peptidoglycan hydrolase CwlO-like protein
MMKFMTFLVIAIMISLSVGCSSEQHNKLRQKVDEQNERMLQQGAEADTLMKKLDNNVQDIQQQAESMQRSLDKMGSTK